MTDEAIKERIRERERFEKAKELTGKITDFVNNYNCPKDKFIEAFQREHRTLQQSTFRLFFELMEAMAELPDTHIDLRNQATRDVCRELVELYEDKKGYKPSQSLPTV